MLLLTRCPMWRQSDHGRERDGGRGLTRRRSQARLWLGWAQGRCGAPPRGCPSSCRPSSGLFSAQLQQVPEPRPSPAVGAVSAEQGAGEEPFLGHLPRAESVAILRLQEELANKGPGAP